jgi:hypothetical protein
VRPAPAGARRAVVGVAPVVDLPAGWITVVSAPRTPPVAVAGPGAAVPRPPPVAVPPQPSDATHTGAFALTGAAAAIAGSMVVSFAWTAPIDFPAPWGPPPSGPPNGVAVSVPSPPAAFPPQPFDATHTGALTVAGAEAAAAGETVVPLACTVPTD